MSMSYRSTLHRDGTVTLWDVYAQAWVRTTRPADRDLAAMDHAERARVEEHLSRFDPADGVEVDEDLDGCAYCGDDNCDGGVTCPARGL